MSDREFRFSELIPFDAKMEPDAIAVGYLSRLFDNKYLVGSDWFTERTSNNMSAVPNNPDLHRFIFDTALGKLEDTYTFEPVNNSIFKTRDNAIISVKVSQFFNTMRDKVSRILGLSHENIFVQPLTYNTLNGEPETSLVKTYDSAANANGGATGLQDTYDVSSVFDVEGKLVTFTQTRVGG